MAKEVLQIEIMPMPPAGRGEENPWPQWPAILRTSTSHEEGCERTWNILTKEFIKGSNGQLTGIKVVNVAWEYNQEKGRSEFKEDQGSERIIPCDLAFLAIGFLHAEKGQMLEDLGVTTDQRGNVIAQDYHTVSPGVFVAGDMRRGQSLVVWAISEGREAAAEIGKYLGAKENISSSAILRKKSRSILSV